MITINEEVSIKTQRDYILEILSFSDDELNKQLRSVRRKFNKNRNNSYGSIAYDFINKKLYYTDDFRNINRLRRIFLIPYLYEVKYDYSNDSTKEYEILKIRNFKSFLVSRLDELFQELMNDDLNTLRSIENSTISVYEAPLDVLFETLFKYINGVSNS